MAWQAIGMVASAVASELMSRQGASDSSALQYKYQSALNKQNLKYSLKLINTQNAFNEAMMDKANEFNSQSWEKSADLAKNAHFYEVQDLRNAGLNPILSANGGASVVSPIQSAQTQSGGATLSSSAGMADIDYMSGLGTAMNMYNSYKSTKSQLKNDNTNRIYTSALTDKVYTDVDNSIRTTASEIAKRDAEIRNLDNDIKLSNYDAETRRMAVLNDITSSNYTNKYHRALTNSAVAELEGKKASEKAQAEWIKNHPGLYSFGQTMQNIAPGLVGAGLVGSAGAQIYNSLKKQPTTKRKR